MKEVCFKALLEGFESPEREYYPSVMWFWNDTLDHGEITAQLTERLVAMAERLEAAGVRTVWINSLPETAVDTASCVTMTDREAEDAVALLADGYDACSLRINGREIGCCLRAPFRFDVTGALCVGKNVIELTETRTLQNFFATPDRRIPVGLRGEPVLLLRNGE